MPTILDIFRTNSGKKLLERTRKETEISTDQLKRSFSISLPVTLVVFSQNPKSIFESLDVHKVSFTEFTENKELLRPGIDILKKVNTENKEGFLVLEKILGISEANSTKIFQISSGAIYHIIAEIQEKEPNAEISKIINSLLGLSSDFEEAFINCLVKNPENAGFIDPGEKIAFGKDIKDDDQSILGGYSGGR